VSTPKKSSLGKGLGALLPENFDDSLMVDQKERIQILFVKDIHANPSQPRQQFDKESLEELASSIKTYGVLQPLVVTPDLDGGHKIIAGERRWRAAQIANLKTVPALVRTSKELEQLEISLVENVQRVDLSPLEQAASIEKLHQQFSMSYESIAKRLGKALATVSNISRLLQLPANAKKSLNDNKITEGHARAILAVKNPKLQNELLKNIIQKGWTVRQAEQFAIAVKTGTKTPKIVGKHMETSTPETKKLSQKLNTDIKIRRTAKGGKLEIKFSSDKDLERIIKLLSS